MSAPTAMGSSSRRCLTTTLALVFLVTSAFSQQPGSQNPVLKRFEYKHSFRAPNLSQRDGTIPFWSVTGDAIASSEQLRLAPSMRSRKGIAWNKRALTESDNFELEVAVKIAGQGRIGADGMAIWYTSQLGTMGPVFGANDFWTGMGVFLDSFDNDGQKNNPFVSVMINDGTRSYDHQTDGTQQILSGCQKDFRNKPYPVRVKIEYVRNVLTVFIHDGLTQQPRYELCVRAENIFLPKAGYFGISAATGGLADDHDVLDFSVYSVYLDGQRPTIPAPSPIPQEEKQKYDAEFEKQMHEYEEERKKYKEQHPDKARSDEEDEQAKYFEDHATRELRFIHESQNAIHRVLQQMDTRLQEIGQQQKVHTTMITSGQAAAVQHPGQPPVVSPGDSFQQHEKNEVLQHLRDLTASLRDVKNYVNEVFTRTYNIEQKIGAGGAGGGAQAPQDLSSIKNYLDGIQNEVQQIRSAQQAQQVAPQHQNYQQTTGCPSCLSTTIFIVIIAIQSAVIIVFVFMRSKNDKAKFY